MIHLEFVPTWKVTIVKYINLRLLMISTYLFEELFNETVSNWFTHIYKGYICEKNS